METIEVYRQGKLGGLAAMAALVIVFLVALFLAPLLTDPFFSSAVFASLVTLVAAGAGYVLKRLFGTPIVSHPVLRLEPDGIWITAPRVGLIPWRAIRRVEISETSPHIASSSPTVKPRVVEVWTDDDDSYLRRVPVIHRLYARADQSLGAPLFRLYPDSLTMTAKDMVAVFRKCAPEASFEGLEFLERKNG
ncbi:MAG: hypothetical protein ACR2PI_11745 [Hyphomicrobiaceae bacterium]